MSRRLVRTRTPRQHGRGWLLATLGALSLLAALPATAAQIVVTTTEDEITADGDCSLREAFFAASSNASRDACPAGSNTSTDDIVLAADAAYSLTIPEGGGSNGLSGSLQVLNNTAATDVAVTVAGGGTATISQDAVPDTRVLAIATGAKLTIDDTVIQGGTTTGASNRGGGILIASGGTLGLARCVLRENRSEDSGGAIRNQGTLVIDDSVLHHNVTDGAGGAISSSGNTSTLIRGTLFADNEAGAQFAGGGAIDSSDLLTVQDSTFVDNRARTIGGAIAHFDDTAGASTISQSCFIGNIANFSGNAVDVFSGSQPLAAPGAWWGSTDGPGGVGGGSGDGVSTLVTFDPESPDVHAVCLPFELVGNGGFQSDRNEDGIPERWTPTLLTPADGRACSDGGPCIVKMRGNGNLKRLEHVIRVEGAAGDAFTFRARSRAKDVPTTPGAYRAVVAIVHADGSQQSTTLNFSTGKHGFERLTQQVTANEDYDEIRVRVEYGKFGGVVRFDSVSLEREP